MAIASRLRLGIGAAQVTILPYGRLGAILDLVTELIAVAPETHSEGTVLGGKERTEKQCT